MSTLAPVNPGYRLPKLRTLDPLQLQDKPVPERRWIVTDWVPHSQTTMLTGDGGVGNGGAGSPAGAASNAVVTNASRHSSRSRRTCSVGPSTEGGQLSGAPAKRSPHMSTDARSPRRGVR